MHINYFAFGSNLSSARLFERIPAASVHCVATLHSHRLRWHKKSQDRSGKCDIEFTDCVDDHVYGVACTRRMRWSMISFPLGSMPRTSIKCVPSSRLVGIIPRHIWGVA